MVRLLSDKERSPGFDLTRITAEERIILRPLHFRVVDGDTLAVRSAHPGLDGEGATAFRIRFRSVGAAETPSSRGSDWILKSSGADPHWWSKGAQATAILKDLLKPPKSAITGDRVPPHVLLVPTGKLDKYGRMVADAYGVFYKTAEGSLDLARAISLEKLLLEAGVVEPFRQEQAPALHPDIHDEPS